MAQDQPGFEMGDFKVEGEPLEQSPGVELPELTGDEPLEVGVSDVEQVVEGDDDELTAQLMDEELTDEERRALLDKYYPLPEDFPAEDQLNAWQAEHGRIRVHRVAPNEAYVVRAMTRAEFRKYLQILKVKFGSNPNVDAAEERMFQEELLVERCTLWPQLTGDQIRGETKPVHKVGLAGTVTVLAFDIQEISNLIESNVGPFEEL